MLTTAAGPEKVRCLAQVPQVGRCWSKMRPRPLDCRVRVLGTVLSPGSHKHRGSGVTPEQT